MNFSSFNSSFKSLGQTLGSSLADLEASLAQVIPDSNSTPPRRTAQLAPQPPPPPSQQQQQQQQQTQPSLQQRQSNTAPSPSRINTSSSNSEIASLFTSSPTSSSLPSASAVADSFRERLRKGRQSIETASKSSIDLVRAQTASAVASVVSATSPTTTPDASSSFKNGRATGSPTPQTPTRERPSSSFPALIDVVSSTAATNERPSTITTTTKSLNTSSNQASYFPTSLSSSIPTMSPHSDSKNTSNDKPEMKRNQSLLDDDDDEYLIDTSVETIPTTTMMKSPVIATTPVIVSSSSPTLARDQIASPKTSSVVVSAPQVVEEEEEEGDGDGWGDLTLDSHQDEEDEPEVRGDIPASVQENVPRVGKDEELVQVNEMESVAQVGQENELGSAESRAGVEVPEVETLTAPTESIKLDVDESTNAQATKSIASLEPTSERDRVEPSSAAVIEPATATATEPVSIETVTKDDAPISPPSKDPLIESLLERDPSAVVDIEQILPSQSESIAAEESIKKASTSITGSEPILPIEVNDELTIKDQENLVTELPKLSEAKSEIEFDPAFEPEIEPEVEIVPEEPEVEKSKDLLVESSFPEHEHAAESETDVLSTTEDPSFVSALAPESPAATVLDPASPTPTSITPDLPTSALPIVKEPVEAASTLVAEPDFIEAEKEALEEPVELAEPKEDEIAQEAKEVQSRPVFSDDLEGELMPVVDERIEDIASKADEVEPNFKKDPSPSQVLPISSEPVEASKPSLLPIVDSSLDLHATSSKEIRPSEDTLSAIESERIATTISSPAPIIPATSASTGATPETSSIRSADQARLESLKSSLDKIVSKLFPSLESGVSDIAAFEAELNTLHERAETSSQQVTKLGAQLKQQTERIEELRDTHRLETQSSTADLDALRTDLAAKDERISNLESKLNLVTSTSQDVQSLVTRQTDEYEKLRLIAKEEEEKRIKALSLLRALRQKLVKAEKDKETAENERDSSKAAEERSNEMLKSDRARFDQEIVSLRAAQELQLSKMRSGYDRELASFKAQHERELQARKSQAELEIITLKATQVKDVNLRDQRIFELEQTVKDMTNSRDETFAASQKTAADLESRLAGHETLESQMKELQFELKEVQDRNAALLDELEGLRKRDLDIARDENAQRRALADAEARHAQKTRDLEAKIIELEKDRVETDDEWRKNLQERLKEVERMRAAMAQKDIDYAESVHRMQEREAKIEQGEKERQELTAQLTQLQAVVKQLKEENEGLNKAEAAAREELNEKIDRTTALENRVEELQNKESTLRSSHKALREELRKLQSGVLLSEKQRHPGVGYFSNLNASTSTVTTAGEGMQSPPTGSVTSPPATPSKNGSTVGLIGGDEALNFEYIRNVILQFLERPEMRPHLVGVLGVILHFTPAESRRLQSKAGA